MDKGYVVKNIDQLNETLSTQHTKIYLTDDRLILSGANLEQSYFTNRQDRYLEFTNPAVVRLFGDLAELIAQHSYAVRPDFIEDFQRIIDFDDFAIKIENLLGSINPPAAAQSDAVFYPNVQAGWMKLNKEIEAVLRCVSQ